MGRPRHHRQSTLSQFPGLYQNYFGHCTTRLCKLLVTYCAQPQLKDGHLEHKIHCKFNAFPPFRYIYYQACILHRTHLRKLDEIHIFSQKVRTILETKYQFLGNILCCLDIIHPLHVGNLVHDTQAKQAHTR